LILSDKPVIFLVKAFIHPMVADLGCLSRIQIFPSRIHIKELKYFNSKPNFSTHPGSRGQKRPRNPDPDSQP
jgi:hypothetical protein